MNRSVDRYLAGLLVLLLLTAAAGAVPGFSLLGQDLEQSGEWLDGLGVVFGLGILTVVAVPATVALVALLRLRDRRESAWRWALAAGVLGCLAVVPFGFFSQPLFVALVVPALLVAVAYRGLRSQGPAVPATRSGAGPGAGDR